MVIDASNMASVVAAMNTDFSTPHGAAEGAEATELVSPENGAQRTRVSRRGALVHLDNETPEDEDTDDKRSKGGAFSTKGEERPHHRTRASAGKRDTGGRCTTTPCCGQRTERVNEAQGALVRRVDKTLEDKDAKDRRSKGGAFSTGVEEGPHQRTRASAGKRGTSGRRARTPCRRHRIERVVEAQGASVRCVDETTEDENAKERRSKGGPFSPRGEEKPHQQARACEGEHGTSGRRARTPRRGQVTESVDKAQEDPNDAGEAEVAGASPTAVERLCRQERSSVRSGHV